MLRKSRQISKSKGKYLENRSKVTLGYEHNSNMSLETCKVNRQQSHLRRELEVCLKLLQYFTYFLPIGVEWHQHHKKQMFKNNLFRKQTYFCTNKKEKKLNRQMNRKILTHMTATYSKTKCNQT